MTSLAKIEPINTSCSQFDQIQLQLLKTTICKGASDEELRFFISVCQKTGLDPFSRQIYSIPRGGQRTIQVSVDGLRAIADRTGRYAPGRPTEYIHDNGNLISATAYVKKQTDDGTWHEIGVTAFWSEYNAKNNIWKQYSYQMLSKCAECLALRKAFPAQLSGLYGQEEMSQSETGKEYNFDKNNVKPLYIEENKLSIKQVMELQSILNECSPEFQKQAISFLPKKYKVSILDEVPETEYEYLKETFLVKQNQYQKELVQAEINNKIQEE